jgi:hypothetical protein
MFGNRGIYHCGLSAVTKHRTPLVMVGGALRLRIAMARQITLQGLVAHLRGKWFTRLAG